MYIIMFFRDRMNLKVPIYFTQGLAEKVKYRISQNFDGGKTLTNEAYLHESSINKFFDKLAVGFIG